MKTHKLQLRRNLMEKALVMLTIGIILTVALILAQ